MTALQFGINADGSTAAPTARLSLFSSHNETTAARFITLAELAAMAEQPTTGPKGNAALITPFESQRKTADAARQAKFAALAIDHDSDNRTADDIRTLYGPAGLDVCYLAFTSSHHMQEKSGEPAAPRWKVLVPFAAPVDADTAAELAAGIAYSLTTDAAQARKQQGFYAPNKLQASAPYECINELGEPWQWLYPDDAESRFIQEATQGWAEFQEAEAQATSQAKAKPRPLTKEQAGIIGRILEAYHLAELLEGGGYKRKASGLYLSPYSGSGVAGVKLLERDGKQVVYSHHGPADPLSASNHEGHALDVADVLCALSYGGDFARMIQAEAERLDTGGQQQRQREHMQELERQRKAEAFNAPPVAGSAPVPEAPAGEPAESHHLTRFVDIGQQPEPPAWILPGFIAEGVVMIAGGHGVGKTTTLLPLALAAAGVHPPQYELAPEHWRHVVYITEDTAQAGRIVAGYGEHLDWPGGRGVPDKIRERLHVVEARRAGAGYVALAGAYYREHFTRTVITTGTDGRQYTAELLPLVAIDTLAATIHLENENDNSEASAAIAALKQQFAGLPVWIIGHTAKANLGRSDAITARGASAFEADANQVLYLVNEDKKGRWLMRGKTRFEAKWPELEIHSDSRTITAVNRFGAEESLTLRWAVAVPPEQGRAQRIEQAKAEGAERDREALRARILQAVTEAHADGQRFNKTALRTHIGGNRAEIGGAVDALLAEGWLYEVEIPKAERLRNKPSFLIALDETERQAFKASGTPPQSKLDIPPDWKKQPQAELESARDAEA
ncbi:AAA family ATPase [Ectopseudomonas oleovorans]|uniref:AAA family ATPase n=1 Tax=Ectopseudomonas oleovorans TaxID=301 RepID=UPI00241D2A79|nr:AAA family ATPase [Pseudomonas oleovorans]